MTSINTSYNVNNNLKIQKKNEGKTGIFKEILKINKELEAPRSL
jgi:hypothetical protein